MTARRSTERKKLYDGWVPRGVLAGDGCSAFDVGAFIRNTIAGQNMSYRSSSRSLWWGDKPGQTEQALTDMHGVEPAPLPGSHMLIIVDDC